MFVIIMIMLDKCNETYHSTCNYCHYQCYGEHLVQLFSHIKLAIYQYFYLRTAELFSCL